MTYRRQVFAHQKFLLGGFWRKVFAIQEQLPTRNVRRCTARSVRCPGPLLGVRAWRSLAFPEAAILGVPGKDPWRSLLLPASNLESLERFPEPWGTIIQL